MNLRSLLSLVAVASLLFAKTAQAGLGWTFAECTKHWGYPVKQPVLNEFGLKECTFNGRPTFEAIQVSFSPEGKAICIIYMSPDAGTIDEMQDAIMKNNFPGASWSPDVPRNTEALKFWSAKENGVEVVMLCERPGTSPIRFSKLAPSNFVPITSKNVTLGSRAQTSKKIFEGRSNSP